MRSFFYDGDRIISEREGNSWVVRHLVTLSPLLPVGFVSGGSIRIYHSDRLESVRYVTGSTDSTISTDNLLVSYVYEGFGRVIAQNGGGGGLYQFCGLWGYRNDHDAGLLHVGARYYESETGRFVQKDPELGSIWSSQSLHRYIYVVNNPAFVDPTGYRIRLPKPIEELLKKLPPHIAVILVVIIVIIPCPCDPTDWIIWGIGAILNMIADDLFPPEERCCGGQCDRNPPPPVQLPPPPPFPLPGSVEIRDGQIRYH